MKNNPLYKEWWFWPALLIDLQLLQLPIIVYSSFKNGSSVVHWLGYCSDILIVLSILLIVVNVILWICYIVKKRKLAIWGHLAMMLMAIPLFVFITLFIGVWFMFSSDAGDDFGKRHPIPAGAIYEKPIRDTIYVLDENGSLVTQNKLSDRVIPSDSSTWLQIRDGFQGGIYEYCFYISEALNVGEIWLECYEASKNKPLSAKRIRKESAQKVGPEDKETTTDLVEFTISEGVWGDYYLARIEVWYADSISHTSRKLTEKTYRVEGWQR